MKNKIKILGATLITIMFLGACEKINIEPIAGVKTPTANRPIDLNEPQSGTSGTRIMIAPGTWRISTFPVIIRDRDIQLFDDYIFKFNTNGMLTAIRSYIEEQGKWGGGDGSLRINFGSAGLLRRLNNNNWVITRYSVNHIELQGISPFDQKVEYLIFERVMVY